MVAKTKNCIDCATPIGDNVKLRCRPCWIKAKVGLPYGTPAGAAPREPDVILWHQQDDRFCLAMIRAAEQGAIVTFIDDDGMCQTKRVFEKITRGVCKHPGTQRPMDRDQLLRHLGLPPRDISIRSSSAWMDEMGGI